MDLYKKIKTIYIKQNNIITSNKQRKRKQNEVWNLSTECNKCGPTEKIAGGGL